MIIIDKKFKGTSDLYQYLREQSGFVEATAEEKEAWSYDTPLWTSPSNFIGRDLIYRGEEVGPITGTRIHTTHRGTKNISYDTVSGNYKFSYSHVRFFNKLYGKEEVLSLHPTRGGMHMWSRGFVLHQKEYKSMYYETDEYQTKYGHTMMKRHGVIRPYRSEALKAKASQAIHEKYGVDWFLSRGPHYSAITSTMVDKYGVETFFSRGEHYSAVTETMIERYGVENIFMAADLNGIAKGMSKREREMVDFLEEKLEIEKSDHTVRSLVQQQSINDAKEKRTYHVDFMDVARKIVVEFNGDYWHCNPALYESSYIHKHKKMTAQEIWDYDVHRKKRIEHITGYRVITVWERDWHNRKEKTKKWLLEQILS